MAILNNIRKRGVFLIIIIALALFSFILADVIRNGGFASEKSQTTVAVVNGEEIGRESFMQQVESTQRTLGPNGTTGQAMNRVWDNEIRNILLSQEFEKLGLSAEKSQINNALRLNLATNQTFLNDAGVFDEGKLQEYIASIKASNPTAYQQWLDFEKSTEQGVLQNSYYTMIQGGLRSTLAEGELEYRFENDKVNLQYVQIPYSKIADEDVTVSDEDIRSYVKSHADEFEVDPKVDIQYVSFMEAPSDEDIQDTKNNLYSLIQKSYADALAALKKFRATEKALISMEESFKYTEKKFEVGLVNTVDYNTSKNQLTMTQSELLQAKYDFIFKTKILNFYKGEAITL